MEAVWTFEQTIPQSAERVADVLFEIWEGPFSNERAPFILAGTGKGQITRTGDEKYVVQYAEGNRVYLFSNEKRRTMALQGAWWYRGEYSLSRQTDQTSSLQLQVFNVAQRFRWIAALMILPEKNQHRKGFEALVARLKSLH